jgi:hypothetical protein
MTGSARANGRAELAALGALTAVLSATRLYAAAHVGFGDSEALYAAYAQHPQPAYLDHPGLIGLIARVVGGGGAPSPFAAHLATTWLAALFPWTVVLACVACGASWRRAALAALVVAFVPEIAIGLFALTPDLPLAIAWTGSLACAAAGLKAPPRSVGAMAGLACAGTLAGVAIASKASGVLLATALAATYASTAARPHRPTMAPWAGLVAAAVVALPIARFEACRGWPMLRHRLVETQSGAGLALRNAAALVGGQLVYLSPVVVALAVWAGRRLWADRRLDAVGALLFRACVVPASVLVPLCLWSRVAEPHWIAPALLALPLAAARTRRDVPRRLLTAALATSGALVTAVYAWVLVPVATLLAPAGSDAKLDITNELYGWPEVLGAVRSAVALAPAASFGDVAVVGPHWVVCAQLEAGLRGDVAVGCNTPVPDDFDGWWPRARWRTASTIVWVSDARFGRPPPLPWHAPVRTIPVTIVRAGRVVRRFVITTLSRRASALGPPASGPPRGEARDRLRPPGSAS